MVLVHHDGAAEVHAGRPSQASVSVVDISSHEKSLLSVSGSWLTPPVHFVTSMSSLSDPVACDRSISMISTVVSMGGSGNRYLFCFAARAFAAESIRHLRGRPILVDISRGKLIFCPHTTQFRFSLRCNKALNVVA